MTSHDFFWDKATESSAQGQNDNYLSTTLLVKHAEWFISLRWAAIIIFLFYWLFSNIESNVLSIAGIQPSGRWPLLIGLILTFANILFIITLRKKWIFQTSLITPIRNIWFQIFTDLVILTTVIHFIGSTSSVAPLLYVIHIALACVFFKPSQSFVVTAMSVAFYLICFITEKTGIFGFKSLFHSNATLNFLITDNSIYSEVLSTSGLLFVVWYMVSRLSEIVRRSQWDLIKKENDLHFVMRQKDQYAFQMVHQLKAPVDTIRSAINMAGAGYYGEIPSEFQESLQIIENRAILVSRIVIDIMRLVKLKTESLIPEQFIRIDLMEIITKCIEDVRILAKKKDLLLFPDLKSVFIKGDPEQISLLVNNLLSNAIQYSKENGKIWITCIADFSEGHRIIIKDSGIGIDAENISRIFDDFYRTPAAAQYNKCSTGIGLSIVKHVAQTHNIRLRVKSEKNAGSEFTAIFPL